MWVDDMDATHRQQPESSRLASVDLENAILIHDLSRSLPLSGKRLELIRTHTTIVNIYRDATGRTPTVDKSA